MSGNVWEWNEDWYHDSYDTYGDGTVDAPDDGSAWVDTGDCRVIRGGSFSYAAVIMRSAERTDRTPSDRSADSGARCVRLVPDCQPNCQGKVCGPDGCGGSCGSCQEALPVCDSGQCKMNCAGLFQCVSDAGCWDPEPFGSCISEKCKVDASSQAIDAFGPVESCINACCAGGGMVAQYCWADKTSEFAQCGAKTAACQSQ